MTLRPHTLGIDDGPFEKGQAQPVSVVGVLMEGHDLVEAVARTEFPVDGAGATEFLAAWIRGLRLHAALHAVILGGITIAGLGVIDVRSLARAIDRAVLVVNRRRPESARLQRALCAAGLTERIPVLEASPPALAVDALHLACAGTSEAEAAALLRSTRHKSRLPEPLRLAHLIATACVRGVSHGRA